MEQSAALPPYAVAVLVLTGGRSRRMGTHKPSLEVGGRPMVTRVHDAVRPRPVLVVGRPDHVPDGIPVVVEDPPGSGPAAAVATGLAHLPAEADVVLVLAADMPFITSDHLDRLVDAVLRGDAESGPAVTTDADGRINWLCSAWRRSVLVGAVARLGDPAARSMRDLAAGLRVTEVADAGGVGADVDTPADLERARRRLAAGHAPGESPVP